MKFYNEERTERKIKRKAMFVTFAIMFILSSVLAFSTSPNLRDSLPDSVKEWFKKDIPEEKVKIQKDRA